MREFFEAKCASDDYELTQEELRPKFAPIAETFCRRCDPIARGVRPCWHGSLVVLTGSPARINFLVIRSHTIPV